MFVDLWLRSERLVDLAGRLGYGAVAVEGLGAAAAGGRPIAVEKVVVEAEEVGELKKKIEGVKRRRVLVGVVPLSASVARWAAHDGRVDTIIMRGDNAGLFDKKQASVMKYYGKPLELPLSEVLELPPRRLAEVYRRLARLVWSGVAVVVSSGASEPSELHHPLVAASFVAKLLDLPAEEAKRMLTVNPVGVLAKGGAAPWR